MNLSELITEINELSDEYHDSSTVTRFINAAIAKINAECKSNFPFVSLTDSNSEYAGFGETWQRLLLVPFGVGRAKQKEGEASEGYSEFMANLVTFQANYQIPEEYKDTNSLSSFEIDLSESPYGW